MGIVFSKKLIYLVLTAVALRYLKHLLHRTVFFSTTACKIFLQELVHVFKLKKLLVHWWLD